MKKKADFVEQIKNSEQFLEKLNGFKRASKEIKEKNKLGLHRNIWVKEFKFLTKLERDSVSEIQQYFEEFDKSMEYQIEDKQVFARQPCANYTQYLAHLEQDFQNYEYLVWQQLNSLPLLLQKTKEMTVQPGKAGIQATSTKKTGKGGKTNEVPLSAIGDIVQDIGQFLSQNEQTTSQQLQELEKLNPSRVAEPPNEDEQCPQFTFLKPLIAEKGLLNEVKGFDFQQEQRNQIEQGEAHLREYFENLEGRLSGDEISEVIEEYRRANSLLDQAFELETEKINLDYEEVLNLNLEGSVGVSENYQKIQHIYNTYMGRGKSISLYYERLGIQFPRISRKLLETVTQYVEAKIFKARKINAIRRNYWREKEDLLTKVEKEVQDRVEAKINHAHKEAERLSRKEEKLKLEQELERLRGEYLVRKAEKIRAQEEHERRLREEEKKKEELRQLYLNELSQKTAQIQEIKQKRHAQESQRQQRIQQQKEQEQRRVISQNKPKVMHRQSIERKKIQEKLEHQKQQGQQQIKNEERIANAVEKYSFRPQVEASQQRVNAPTQALLRKKQLKYDKADKVELTKMTGYTINSLMGDMRYRLNAALSEVGLANTEYARQVLNQMSRRPE